MLLDYGAEFCGDTIWKLSDLPARYCGFYAVTFSGDSRHKVARTSLSGLFVRVVSPVGWEEPPYSTYVVLRIRKGISRVPCWLRS